MISCHFKLQKEYPMLFDVGKVKYKEGRYHQSSFPNIESNRWIVASYLESHEIDRHLEENVKTEKEIVDECIEYLNSIMEKIKGKKKEKLKYGKLELYSYEFRKVHEVYMDRENYQYKILVLLTTHDKNSSYFWGEGREHDK